MTDKANSSSHSNEESLTEKVMLPCDHRYRTSTYFLQDQLRCSEAAADFKSVKDLVSRAPSFSTKSAFQFQVQPATIPIHPSEP